ncbi:YkvA family protein [Pseudonocardia sp. KRD291]|uniref:YkvA family protein n=1 Tax=Pseudonocardia sp. KRD291 TaxID=2792007 RepID=UPI001C4A4000|nr:YkvA family protein [Pseudonocardia sp. KRD291]MBW0102342.1 DUF1232 domain-containing protein [Pseudonocardia sp. KRD291]
MRAATALTAPRRIAAFRALWRALSRRARPGEPGTAERLQALPKMVGDSATGTYPHLGKGRLALFAMALVYLVSPVDLVPEAFLTVFGLGDDAVMAMWLGGALLVEADRYLGWQRQRPTIIDELPRPALSR